ncbi:MAG: GAF domain-containing protein, partial [Elusimicrobia bacterium]|nr:GAF domain-containing protein [Elusimicrobiota bacterium]
MAGLLLPLAGFFVYAVHAQDGFFPVLALALLVDIAILFSFQRRLQRKQAEVVIQKEDFFEKTNLLKAELENDRAEIAAFREEIVAYAKLKGFAEKVSNNLSLDDTADAIAHEVGEMLKFPGATLLQYLIDPKTGGLGLVHSRRDGHAVAVHNKNGDIFDRWVVKTLQPLLVQDSRTDFRFDTEKVPEEDRGVRSVLSVPLLVGTRLIGIFRFDSPVPGSFSKEGLRFLRTIGDVAAVALENAQLFDRVEDLAIRDSLTGLFLRRHLWGRIAEEVGRHTRLETPLSFLMIDLDHFRKYN